MTDYQKAKSQIPKGYYVLPQSEPIRDTDLVWDFSNNKFYPADSEHWLFPTDSIDREEIICVIRQGKLENFEPVKQRTFVIKKEVQGSLF